MATQFVEFQPEEAQFLTTAFPGLVKNVGTNFPVLGLAYDASIQETAYWKFRATNYLSGDLTLKIYWYADTAIANSIVWEAGIAVITPDTDSQDVETKAFAAINFVQDTHLGTVIQRLHVATISISNLDSIATDDIIWIKIARDADGTNATDDLTGDAIFVMAVLSFTT